jgi:hypothetical protein
MTMDTSQKKAVAGILWSLLTMALFIFRDIVERVLGTNSDVLFLTAFLVYAFILYWIIDKDEKTLLLLMGTLALLAPSLGTLQGQPGVVTLEDSFREGLEFSVIEYLLLSASGITYYYVLSRVSKKTGVRMFKIQGLLYLIATVGSVTALGIFGLIGWLLAVPASHFVHYRAIKRS